MRTSIIVRGLAALTAVWLAGGWTLHGQERAAITKAQVDRWMQELSNWGRWGAVGASRRRTNKTVRHFGCLDYHHIMNVLGPAGGALGAAGGAVGASRRRTNKNLRHFGC